jgi:hypothetical protein
LKVKLPKRGDNRRMRRRDLIAEFGDAAMAQPLPASRFHLRCADQATDESAPGTELPIRNARAAAAIWGKADPDQATLDKLDL